VQTWLSSSLRRFYPASPAERGQALTLDVARGERVSFQAVCRAGAADQVIHASASAADGLAAQVRRVGYVPMPHHSTETPLEELEGAGHIPGYVPDR
jgi:hypothetical protein